MHFHNFDSWVLFRGQSKESIAMFDTLLHRRLRPGVVTYNSSIDGMCRRGDPSKANELWDDMHAREIFPNHVMYNTLIDSHC
jgi:pentatricopeptide repeat protein